MPNGFIITAAALATAIALAHSYLGERFIIRRLLRRGDLPRISGSDTFTKRTLRFAWHLTTVALIGLAAVLLAVDSGPAATIRVVGVTLIIGGVIILGASRGRHLAWPVMVGAGALALAGA